MTLLRRERTGRGVLGVLIEMRIKWWWMERLRAVYVLGKRERVRGKGEESKGVG
jgi:hypothetical protein